MHLKLHRYPFVRLTAALLVGVVGANYMPPIKTETILLVILVLAVAAWIFSNSGTMLFKKLSGFLLSCAVAFIGVLQFFGADISNRDNHFSHQLRKSNDCIFRIERIKQNYSVAKMIEMNGQPAGGDFLLNYPKSLTHPGEFDVVFAQLKVNSIDKPLNPKVFDFKRFQASKGIYHRAYVENYRLLKSDDVSWQRKFFRDIRNYCIAKLDKIGSKNERAIAKALIVGDKRDLDEDLRNAFADSGAMHVLAVSGLHVGVIFLLISWLFGHFEETPNLRVVRCVTSLLIIWTFAMVAGGTASVCRAAFMFSLIAIGKLLNRSAYSLNSLAAAAFFLILFDPRAIFDVGFQLSFLAVGGIIICHKPMEELWIIENKLGHKMWSAACVSLTATLFTLPLTIYYFHQFPLYSWLSGIVVVELAFAILSSGLFYLVMANVPVLGFLALKLLNAFLYLLSSFINLFQKIPYVSIENIWLSKFELGLIGAVIFCVTIGFALRRVKFIKMALVGLLIFSSFELFIPRWFTPAPSATIYHIRGNSYADYLEKGHVSYFNVDKLHHPEERYEIRNHHAFYSATNLHDLMEDPLSQTRWPFIKLLGKKIIRLKDDLDLAESVPPVDIIWIGRGTSIRNMGDLQGTQPLFIIDGATDKMKAKTMASEMRSHGLNVHDTWDEGALNWNVK